MPVVTFPKALASWISFAITASAIWLLWRWHHGEWIRLADGLHRHVRGTAWQLYTGLGLIGWSLLGRFVVLGLIPSEPDAPIEHRGAPLATQAPDGSTLRLDSYGATGSPTLILTHGWGLNGTAWSRTVGGLSDRFRLVTWDLPGLGRSSGPKDGRFSIDRFAEALGAVVEATGEQRVVLVGHSIGGMTTETFWRACPESLQRRVAGIVLVDTTYLDPLETMWGRKVWTALQKPLIEPLNKLAVPLSPLLWLWSWQGYLSGSSHIVMRLTGFGRYATRAQVDLVARLAANGSPAVQAKGNLAMLRWSAEDVLPRIEVPVLILAGTSDIVTLPEASQEMARLIPGARLVEVDGAGHLGFMERADAYNAAIAAFAEVAFRGAAAQTAGPGA